MRTTLMAAAICLALTACKPATPPEDTPPPPAADTTVAPPPDTAAPQAPVATDMPDATVTDTATATATTGGNAAIRMLRASCPGGVSLQTADGGPVRINGADAVVKINSATSYDASDAASGVTVSVVVNPDGTQSVAYTGKGRANGMCTVEDAAPSAAKIALLNATCPGGIKFHADDGGYAYINGKEAKLSVSNPNYYEAKDSASGVTISVSTDGSGKPTVSYTGKNRANGICEVKG